VLLISVNSVSRFNGLIGKPLKRFHEKVDRVRHLAEARCE
jgi:hypothetical protein